MKRLSKALTALMLMTAVVLGAGCKPENDPNNGGGNTYNGHEYVDLGLPSGTLWATCNVGANTPEEYGDYFAWGETITKDYYVDRTYKHFVRTGSNNFKLTKYCCNIAYGSFGYIDSLMVLQSEDDAATTNWGIGWCMPTIDQWSELHQTVLGTWTSQNGVEGLLFTANNGNSLFLPAAGYWGEKYQGGWGWYWSSSLNAKDSRRAGCLTINAGDCRETSVWRVYGHSVRPVRSVSNK